MRSIFQSLLVVVSLSCLFTEVSVAQEPEKPKASLGAVEVHFDDGSVLKLTLQEESFEITTAAGKQTIPLADLRKIELAHRLPEDEARQVAAAIKGLSSKRFPDRQRAAAELVKLGIKAYPALVTASKGADDAETRKRAEEIIDTLKGSLPAELFERVTEDVLWTGKGKLVGKVSQSSWKAVTKQFGVVQVKVGDVVRLHSLAHADPEVKLVAEMNPGTVTHLVMNVGKVYAFRVTGANTGSVWGTGIYTSDSSIARAAIHAGLLKEGQTKVIKVRIVVGQGAYQGSTQNGVTTNPYGPWSGSYEFVK